MAIYYPVYPLAHNDTYVKATTFYSTTYYPHFATDPAKALTGDMAQNQWLSGLNLITNQRFHIDLGEQRIIRRIYYENGHSAGINTTMGAKDFTFWGSNIGASFAELTYATDTGWTQLQTSQATFDQHVTADEVDPKYIVVVSSMACRYLAFKFANSYGYESYIGLRRLNLQISPFKPQIMIF